MQQFRPRDGGPAYNPQRDIAYCYVPAMREAIAGLDKAHWSLWMETYLRENSITEEDLAKAVAALTKSHELFLTTDLRSPAEALERGGFSEQPVAARLLLFARLGEVMLGGFWAAVRWVSKQGNPPPTECQLEELVAAGRLVLDMYNGAHSPLDPAEKLQADLEGSQARCVALQAALAKSDRLMLQAAGQITALKNDLAACQAELTDYMEAGLWARLVGWCRLCWRRKSLW